MDKNLGRWTLKREFRTIKREMKGQISTLIGRNDAFFSAESTHNEQTPL